MSSHAAIEKSSADGPSPGRRWRGKLVFALTVLAFIALASIALYAISLVIGTMVLLAVSALLAYLIYPLVQILQRYLKRVLAVLVVYLLLAGALATGMFIMTSSLVQQVSSLAQSVQFLLSPAGAQQIQSVVNFLGNVGVTQDQVAVFKQARSQTLGTLSGVFPFLLRLFSNLVNLIVIITLSVYFVLDGPRLIHWLTHKTPVTRRNALTFLLHALDQSLGGYFRGSLLIAFIGALCTGVGLTLLHVSYAALLGALFFLFYFVPVIGGYIIEILCILAAWPQGWIMMPGPISFPQHNPLSSDTTLLRNLERALHQP